MPILGMPRAAQCGVIYHDYNSYDPSWVSIRGTAYLTLFILQSRGTVMVCVIRRGPGCP